MRKKNTINRNVFDGAVERLMLMKGSSSETETLRIELPFIQTPLHGSGTVPGGGTKDSLGRKSVKVLPEFHRLNPRALKGLLQNALVGLQNKLILRRRRAFGRLRGVTAARKHGAFLTGGRSLRDSVLPQTRGTFRKSDVKRARRDWPHLPLSPLPPPQGELKR